MGKVIQQELPFNWGVPTTQALVPMSHYKTAERNLANLLAGASTSATASAVTPGSLSQTVHTVFNNNTDKYDVMLGDKVVRSFNKQETAEKFIKAKGTDLLRNQALVGAVPPAVKSSSTVSKTEPMTHKNFVEKWGWDPHEVTADMPKKAPATPVAPKSITPTVSKAEPMTHKNFVEKWGWDPHEVTGDMPKKAPATPVAPKSITPTVSKAEPMTHKKFVEKWGWDPHEVTADMPKKAPATPVAPKAPVTSAVPKAPATPVAPKAPATPVAPKAPVTSAVPKAPATPTASTPLTSAADDIAKKVDWKKIGKYGAIAAGVAAVVGLGIWAYKKHKDNKAEEAAQQDLKPVLPEEKLDIDLGLDLPKIEVPKFEIPKLDIEDGDNAEKPENTEVKTEYTTVKGDSFWKIAERHLKDKFKNEPDKFENLTTQEKNRLIYKETMRIMELNGYKLDENKWFSDPMLHPNVTLKLEEKVDIAA